MKKLVILSLFGLVLFAACKKEKEKDNTPSLKGKWTIENYVDKIYISGTLNGTYTSQGDGATMDFQDNGHVIILVPGDTPESYTYTIKPDSKVDIDGDIYEIKNLTASTVTLLMREDYGGGDYEELYINLKR